MRQLKLPPAAFTLGLVLTAAAALEVISSAHAAEHEVKMLNKGAAGIMVFEPALLEIAPGDTVLFRAVDKGHNAASIDGMVPEGGPTWKGGLGKDVDVTFDVEGVYGVRCVPHYPLGMVALIVVGDPAINLESARQVKQPGRARQRMAELLARLD
jgi:pseudoazurin